MNYKPVMDHNSLFLYSAETQFIQECTTQIVATLHPECKQLCNNQLSINSLTVKGNQKASWKDIWIRLEECSQLRKYQIPAESRKSLREQLAEQAHALSCTSIWSQPMARGEDSKGTDPQPTLPSCQQPRVLIEAPVAPQSICALWPLATMWFITGWILLYFWEDDKNAGSQTHTDKIQANAPCQEKFCLCKLPWSNVHLLLATHKFSLQCWGLNLVPRIALYVFFFHFQSRTSRKTAGAWKLVVVSHCSCITVTGSYVSFFSPTGKEEKRNHTAGLSLLLLQ